MTVYEYIAETNPDAAYMVCRKYGIFQVKDQQELAACLERIVAQDGEDALRAVMATHPDKDILLELFEKKEKEEKPATALLLNATGDATAAAAPPSIVNQSNTIILVGHLSLLWL